MKLTQLLALMVGAGSLVSCATYNTLQNKMRSSMDSMKSDVSGTNPLDPAGSFKVKEKKTEVGFAPGSFLTTQAANTALFGKYPSRFTQPIKTLASNTEVKVISSQTSYTKVELVNTGEVGYVPTVMLGKRRETRIDPAFSVATDSSFDVNSSEPIVPDLAPLNDLLPEGEAVSSSDTSSAGFSVIEDLPFIAPAPENTGIAPPEDVNPLLPTE